MLGVSGVGKIFVGEVTKEANGEAKILVNEETEKYLGIVEGEVSVVASEKTLKSTG